MPPSVLLGQTRSQSIDGLACFTTSAGEDIPDAFSHQKR